MISISINKVKSALLKFKSEIDASIDRGISNLKILKDDSTKSFNKDEIDYIENLITDLDAIVVAEPNVLYDKKYKYPIPNKTDDRRRIEFKDNILRALGYSNLRSNFYPKYFQSIGIKACVYCNSQLTVAVNSKEGVRAKFQVDHFHSKSEYPCFSISLFNLYPVCASCNNAKSDNDVDFDLYKDSIVNNSIFRFELEPISKAKYILDRKIEDIKVNLHPNPLPLGYKCFDINGIYDTQKDIVEELILKAEIYTPAYKKSLIDSFGKLFSNASLSNRLIIGNYSDEDEIHKRPMSKFTQDIAKQLGLI